MTLMLLALIGCTEVEPQEERIWWVYGQDQMASSLGLQSGCLVGHIEALSCSALSPEVLADEHAQHFQLSHVLDPSLPSVFGEADFLDTYSAAWVQGYLQCYALSQDENC